ncbi:MAG: GatB/YqeY domain-containing protein [Parcubacteria group bacterium]|nr:GatB/YqeY domain-containing protein [Parcubacteria group bacterium]
MSLKEKINQDLITALKNGQSEAASSLRFLMSVIKNNELLKRTKLSKENKPVEELEKLSELSDDETVNVILSEIKKRKESIAQYEAGGRADLAEKETKELEIIKKYAPEEMGEEELRAVIKRVIAEIGGITVKDFGKIMGRVMAEIKGRTGGDAVKKIIEEELK